LRRKYNAGNKTRRFRSPQRHAQSHVFEFQILDVQADNLRAPEAARESEQDDRLVPERANVPAAHLTQRDDVLSAERPSTLLAPVESTPDAVEGFAERRANLSTPNIYVGTSSFESISAVQTAECAGPRIVELTAPISF